MAEEGGDPHPRFPTAEAEEISPVYRELHTTRRDQAGLVFGR
ncbi:hypothetical protein [Streptomyces paradoxus]